LNVIQSALWDKAMEGNIPTINALLRVFDLRAKLIGLYSPEKHQVDYEEPDYDLKESVRDMSEMIDLGVKYAEEHGIETAFTKRKKEQQGQKPWEPESY